MSRREETDFGICFLLSLSSISVSVTFVLVFYSTVFYMDPDTVLLPSDNKPSVLSIPIHKHKNNVQFITSKSEKDSEISYSIRSMNQKDSRLWNYIRSHHLTEPSQKLYNLSAKISIHPNQFSRMIYKMFKKRNGVFVEAGAFDGEGASNSLYLEERGWQGLLVECNPIILPRLMSKNRKAWISNACLSPSASSEILNFSTPVDWPASAKLGKGLNLKEMRAMGIDWMKNKTWLEYQVPSFPLFSIIKAVAKFREIDFLSLDVEGSEIDILKHFPFEEIRIKVIMVEVLWYNEVQKGDLDAYLLTKGFDLLRTMDNDKLYVHQFAGLLGLIG